MEQLKQDVEKWFEYYFPNYIPLGMDVLNSINHTTLEALGFKHTLTTDCFKLGALRVFINSDGKHTMTLNDSLIELDLDQLKTIAKSYTNR
jgi:hypothetical protein